MSVYYNFFFLLTLNFLSIVNSLHFFCNLWRSNFKYWSKECIDFLWFVRYFYFFLNLIRNMLEKLIELRCRKLDLKDLFVHYLLEMVQYSDHLKKVIKYRQLWTFSSQIFFSNVLISSINATLIIINKIIFSPEFFCIPIHLLIFSNPMI